MDGWGVYTWQEHACVAGDLHVCCGCACVVGHGGVMHVRQGVCMANVVGACTVGWARTAGGMCSGTFMPKEMCVKNVSGWYASYWNVFLLGFLSIVVFRFAKF